MKLGVAKRNALFWGPVLLVGTQKLVPERFGSVRVAGMVLGTLGTVYGLYRTYKKGVGK